MDVLMKSAVLLHRYTFGSLVSYAFGPRSGIFLDMMLFLYGNGSLLMYFIFLGDFIPSIFLYFTGQTGRIMVLFGLALSGPAVWLPEASFIGKLWLKLRSVQIPVETSGELFATVEVRPDMKVLEFKQELQRLKWDDPEIRKRFEVRFSVENQELLSDDGMVRDAVSRGKTVQAIFGIPEGIKVIEDEAFAGCSSLAEVIVPDSVTEIGRGAFSDCTSLRTLTIPKSVTQLGAGVFANCISLTSVTIPDSVKEIGSEAFRGCTALRHVSIPESVTKIGPSAFRGCKSLTNLSIPESLMVISEFAFCDCRSLTSVTIPESVSVIEREAFGTCTSLTSLIIPDSVTEIDVRAFVDCKSLTKLTIPETVTAIGVRAFFGCTSLTAVRIPESVMEIGAQAFSECKSLTVTIPEWDESARKISSLAFNGASVKRKTKGGGDAS
ncbi:BSPAL1 [Symbiodinium microadriaticum]|nr:BSPAL1 [Symbiodinium microadriaticum]